MRRGFAFDNWMIALLVLFALAMTGWRWLLDHPQHNPWAPLNLTEPPGWATTRKLAQLRNDASQCRALLGRAGVSFTALPPAGEGACRREDRTVLTPDLTSGLALRPAGAQASCAVHAGLAYWLTHGVQPAAEAILQARVIAIEHYGTHSCRRVGTGEGGRWSEHATGNAIDIAAFVLADGRRISVLRDWRRQADEASFLHAVRDSACGVFATVLSPDYNAAHSDHLHFDQAGSRRGWSFCR